VIGAKTMLLSARRLRSEEDALILLAIDDVTDRQAVIDDLDAASHRKDEFLAMLAHELRNPLAAIRNAFELWRRPDSDGAARVRAQSILDWQLQKETRLVDDLLDLSHISRGHILLQRAPLDLAQVVSRAMDEMRHELDARRHQIEVSLPPETVAVEGDAVRLEQVVVNLLANSAKFTQPGGHIAVVLERDGNTAVLSVRDDGIGIPAEQLSTIFDLFFQADRSLDRNPGGLGLGLTLVRRLVELHGGRVEARSPGRDQGSEFVVRLPISDAPIAPATGPRAVAPPSAPRRILVVDDNLDAAESLTMLLQLDGHDVRMTSEGRAALAVAASFAPEIVLLDIGLPGMDGYEVATGLRAQPGGDQMVLVAVTGYGRAEDRERAREARFDHYLLKPIDFAALAEILAA
jgi:two-component system CheB/CheR fusion protein